MVKLNEVAFVLLASKVLPPMFQTVDLQVKTNLFVGGRNNYGGLGYGNGNGSWGDVVWTPKAFDTQNEIKDIAGLAAWSNLMNFFTDFSGVIMWQGGQFKNNVSVASPRA